MTRTELEEITAARTQRLTKVIRPIVEGQIRDFLTSHPVIAEAVDWYPPRTNKATTLVNSLSKRIVNDLVCASNRVRIEAALLEEPTGGAAGFGRGKMDATDSDAVGNSTDCVAAPQATMRECAPGMTRTELEEIVARAIYAAGDSMTDKQWAFAKEIGIAARIRWDARAAIDAVIDAMTEPSEEMVCAGDEEIIAVLNDHTFALKTPTVAHRCWTAMLAAFAPKDEEKETEKPHQV